MTLSQTHHQRYQFSSAPFHPQEDFSSVTEPVSYLFMYVFFLRESECVREWRKSREREGDTESEPGSRLRAVSPEPDSGLELVNREIMA